MLLDTKQGQRAHIAAFRDWIARHPADTPYDWHDFKDCVLCRYFGIPWANIMAGNHMDAMGVAPAVRIASGNPHNDADGERPQQTYGKALARAEAELEALYI